MISTSDDDALRSLPQVWPMSRLVLLFLGLDSPFYCTNGTAHQFNRINGVPADNEDRGAFCPSEPTAACGGCLGQQPEMYFSDQSARTDTTSQPKGLGEIAKDDEDNLFRIEGSVNFQELKRSMTVRIQKVMTSVSIALSLSPSPSCNTDTPLLSSTQFQKSFHHVLSMPCQYIVNAFSMTMSEQRRLDWIEVD
jgi:hypothetical protein